MGGARETRLDPLPIDARLPEVVEALRARGNLVLAAEPGAGKTTRVPRALLDAGLGERGEILVLEPRRLAARMAARRVAEELGEAVGGRVGYQVRFDDRTSRDTRVAFVTEGILTRRLATEPGLPGVSAVVLDELHERSLHTDLGLALLRMLQQGRRPDLHLVAMSATLDTAAVAAFLDCDVLEVAGRTFPVEVEHAETVDDRPLEKRVEVALRRVLGRGLEGDVLVFLPGAAEIRRAKELCEPVAARAGMDVVVLHGDLSADEQDRAVRKGARPKVVLATNVAETSVTLPGVVAVIDSGLARIARTSPWTGLSELATDKVSRASAAQRAGRAGRVRAGLCLRLYTKHDHDTRPPFDEPEIRRADLAAPALMLRAGGHDPKTFPFFERPKDAALEAADALLERLGAVAGGEVTDTGKRLLSLPVHPRQGRLLLEAQARRVLPRGCLVAALVGEREIRLSARTRFDGRDAATDEVGSSDLLARLEAFEAAEAEGSLGARRLRQHDLEVGATLSVARSRDQLARLLRSGTEPEASLVDEEEALLLCTLAAFPDRVGRRRAPRSDALVFAGGGAGRLAPTSVVKEAAFAVAVEVTDRRGSQALVRAASAVEPEHLLELFPERIEELVELRFDRDTEQVERRTALTYDGLPLDESTTRGVSGPEVAGVLADAALEAGLGRFWDLDELETFRGRVAFARRHGLAAPEDWEAWTREALVALCDGARSFQDLTRASLLDALRATLAPDALARLERLAPTHVPIAGRGRVAVAYERDRDPYIASRLQDFFSMADGPRVAEGRVPLVLHLLAPNQRAVQVTTDLAGFWDRHYPDLRKQLMRRYPRHGWPEDPRSSAPTGPGRRGR